MRENTSELMNRHRLIEELKKQLEPDPEKGSTLPNGEQMNRLEAKTLAIYLDLIDSKQIGSTDKKSVLYMLEFIEQKVQQMVAKVDFLMNGNLPPKMRAEFEAHSKKIKQERGKKKLKQNQIE